MIQVQTLSVGPLQANCHIPHNTETREAIIVDPGDEPERIARWLTEKNLRPIAIWNTHAHIDHINGNAALKQKFSIEITIHEAEKHWLQSDFYTVAKFAGIPLNISHADHTWKGGESIEALGAQWKVHHTPGHSPGGVSLVCAAENIMISGDLLFAGSIGRTDLPESDHDAMIASIRGLMTDWGRDEWKVYSGHGPVTTIGEERRTNPFVREFLRAV